MVSGVNGNIRELGMKQNYRNPHFHNYNIITTAITQKAKGDQHKDKG